MYVTVASSFKLTKNTLNSPVTWLLSASGKKVASSNILQSCVNMYSPPAYTHFENVAYSDL